MVLLRGLFLDDDGILHGDGADDAGLFPLFQHGKPLLDGVQNGIVKAARQRDHDAVGGVVGALVFLQPCAGHLVQRGLFAQNGTPQRRAVEHGGVQPFADQVGGIVGVHTDLLQNDAALVFHVLLGEFAVEEHIAQDVQRLLEMGVQAAGVEAGQLLGGEGVDLAADGVHAPRQLLGGAGVRALEEHMLDEVGGTVFGGLFVPGAGGNPDAQRGGADAGHTFRGDAHAVGQGGELIIVHN